MIRIQMKNGKSLGNVEEWFISQISPGESFWFAGQSLELLSFRDMTALVKPSNSGKGKIPSYQGGRMPLSSVVSEFMRQKLMDCQLDTQSEKELIKIRPILDLQKSRSMLPGPEEFLIEYFETKEGFHLVMFPFEGRNVHEGMASFIAKDYLFLFLYPSPCP